MRQYRVLYVVGTRGMYELKNFSCACSMTTLTSHCMKKWREKNFSFACNTPALTSHCIKKWRETPKCLRHGGKKVEIGQTHSFPELQIGQKA